MHILCNLGSCEVIVWTEINRDCMSRERFLFTAIAFNNAVPEDSLGNFEINLYCVPPGPGSVIEPDNQEPFKTIAAKIVPDSVNGILHLSMDDDEYKMSKESQE